MMQAEDLIAKIRSLRPERIAELADFVDFLAQRDDRPLVELATKASEPAFAQVWDNSDDAEYDKL